MSASSKNGIQNKIFCVFITKYYFWQKIKKSTVMNKKILALTTLLSTFFLSSIGQKEVIDLHLKESSKMIEVLTSNSQAKDTINPFTIKGNVGLNFSQATFVNWSSGGDNSFAGTAYLNVVARYRKGHSAWDTDLGLEYGGIWSIDNNEYRKNSDKIDFTTKYGYAVNRTLFITALFDFKTQFTEGYDYSTEPATYTSRFMAPAYSKLSVGLDYKPSKIFSLFFSPITGKMTFLNDTSLTSKYGMIDSNGNNLNPFWFKIEPGAFLKADLNYDITSNINLNTKADFFTPYDDNFGNVDVNWDLILSMKINKVLTTSISTSLKYDDDIKTKKEVNEVTLPAGPKVQFKEVLSIGIGYSF